MEAFLELLNSHNFQGNDVDAIVLPLVPMFHTEAYNLPFRILKEQEVIQLSGLQDFWNNVSLSDAELVPETLLRNVCGNCFHPDLISSALGKNTVYSKRLCHSCNDERSFVPKKKGKR